MSWLSNKLEISHNNHSPLRPMEGLRGFAVFLVFLVHYCSLIEPYIVNASMEGRVLNILHSLGNVGVDLFFVLSGFLIYGTLIKKEKNNFYRYMQRRIIRIYPTFLVLFVAYLFLSVLFPSENKIPNGWWNSSVYIMQNLLLLPGLFDIEPLITVAWSLSYELFYYISIPFIMFLFQLRKWAAKQRVIFWIVISIIGFVYFEVYGGPYRLLMFISGIILFEVFENKLIQLPKYIGTASLLLALGLYLLTLHLQLSEVIGAGILFVLFFLTCLESFSNNDGSAKWLTITPIRWLGNMSYSYYLVHGLTLKTCFLLLSFIIEPNNQFETMFWLVMPFLFLVTLVTSLILFVLIEKPFSLDTKRRNSAIENKIDKNELQRTN